MSLFVNLAAASALVTAGLVGTLLPAGAGKAAASQGLQVEAPAPVAAAACVTAGWPYNAAGCAGRPVRVIALTETAPAVPQAAARPLAKPAPGRTAAR
ncbi:hypothetical protein [Methylobacterium trifolii]|uniref:Porin n=1 Tax=Methylobacterium trifolii TaxID=1003092 RepID=A0ABQ4TXN6_9HYPH|nr:hypothetical protein [Methylobacterium trifolii]GJE58748.1 hypothetical protein MPOCJGCO_0831 [Methylobacterium trifolii]